jgi:hydroxysqualene synthase
MSAEAALLPPTKTPRDESFPVASRLLAGEDRGAVLAFYRFVRAADDIADARDLAPDEKLRRLDALEAELLAPEPEHPLARRLVEVDRSRGTGVAEARRLLEAFRQDARQSRYGDWADLTGYCERSANPVGRFLLRLHGEGSGPEGPADALCTALQILNHLQDLAGDRETLDRVYVPVPWMELAGGEAAFFDPARPGPRRAVLDALLDRTEQLIDEARDLPGRLTSRRLAAQSLLTLAMADALAAKLRRIDPVVERPRLGKRDLARTALATGWRLLRPTTDSDVARAAVQRSRSSFTLGMRMLAPERRRAIHAVYAFCRVVDDIADGAMPIPEKLAALSEWRREIGALGRAPRTPIGRELAIAVERFALPPAEFHGLIDGMEADCASRVRIADDAGLDLYCRRVAGTVGALSIRIFGAPEAEDFALSLGRTLQLVNILRDVDEDAALDRVYLPLDRLGADAPAPELLARPAFAAACRSIAAEAERGFAQADRSLQTLDRRKLKPAILMMEGYRPLLRRMVERGFERRGPRPRLTRRDKLVLLRLAVRPST